MNKYVKGLLFALLAVYVISLADLCPGPIDDIIVILLGMALKKGDEKLIKE